MPFLAIIGFLIAFQDIRKYVMRPIWFPSLVQKKKRNSHGFRLCLILSNFSYKYDYEL